MKFLNTSRFPAVVALLPVRVRRLALVPSAQMGRTRPQLRWSLDIPSGRPLARWQLVPSAQDPGGRRRLRARRMFRGAPRLTA